jgi:hypothetical protein
MRRSTFAAATGIGGLLLVPMTSMPASGSDVATAQVEVEIRDVSCTVIGRSRVAFDPNDGPRGRSIVEFGTTVDDPDPQCHDFVNRIGVIARYRREEDEAWLTSSAENSSHSAVVGSATVPGAIVDAEVTHDVEFFDHSCSLPPRPECGPWGTSFTTDPK